MDVDDLLQAKLPTDGYVLEGSHSSLMEEEPERIYLGDLDIFGLK